MKKRAFTLIELLAVIVILAVIALIATPIVLNVIDNAQKKADLNSANGLIDAGRLYYSESLLNDEKKDKIKNYQNLWDEIIIMGEKPKEGFLYVNPDGNVALSVIYRNTCYQKEFETGLEILKESDCGLGVVGNDTKAPEVKFTVLNNPFHENNWAKEDFYVKIEIIDTESGAKSYEWCRVVGTECEPKSEQLGDTGTVIIDTESADNRICVVGVDNQLNQSEVICSDPYGLDKTHPSLSGIGDIVIRKDEVVDLEAGVSASDSLSGVKGTFTYTPTSVDTSKSGITEVTYQIEDNAGNIQEYKRKVIVETGSPTVTFTLEDGKVNENGWAKEDFLVTITPTDQSGHGIKEYKWCSTTGSSCDPSGNAPQTAPTGAVTISTEGASNRICVIVTDNTGASSTNICSDAYKLDKTAPVFTGLTDLSIALGSTFALDEGVTVMESGSGIKEHFTYIPTSIDTNKIGEVTVVYQVEDMAGNTTSVNRQINVAGYGWKKYNAISTTYYVWDRYTVNTTMEGGVSGPSGTMGARDNEVIYSFWQSYKVLPIGSVWDFFSTGATPKLGTIAEAYQGNWLTSYPYLYQGANPNMIFKFNHWGMENGVRFGYFDIYYGVGVNVDSRGSFIDQVTTSFQSTYPTNGKSGSYWYVYSTTRLNYSQGSTNYGTVFSTSNSTYPANGRHTDGYWYVKV